MTPKQHYRQLITTQTVLEDAGQAVVMDAFEELYLRLVSPNDTAQPAPIKNSIFSGLFKARSAIQLTPPEKGIYIWGEVGRGKTWLMDIFYNQLPFPDKKRYHFHHFMREVHEQLNLIKGQENPLDIVAQEFSKQFRILCLDEFIVIDIGDAMILTGLLKSLFKYGVVLVSSSNIAPDDLYKNGIQRPSFLPAIALLNQHTQVIKIESDTDYRFRVLETANIYHTPIDEHTDERLIAEFNLLAPENASIGGTLPILGRDIPIKRVAHDVVWFDFMALCGPPRSQADYLEISKSFHTVFISDIPNFTGLMDDSCRRFLYLLDSFYDRSVKLIVSAASEPPNLYQGDNLAFDFQRAVSRLQEMQSKDYLAREHNVG